MKYTKETLQLAIDNYLLNELFPTPRGLRTTLELDRRDISSWKSATKKDKKELFDTYKRAEDKILAQIERNLIYGKGGNSTGYMILLAYDRETYQVQLNKEQYEAKEQQVYTLPAASTKRLGGDNENDN